MAVRIKFWLVGNAFTLSMIVSPLFIDVGSVTATPVKKATQPNLIEQLIFHFTGRQKPNRPRVLTRGDRRTGLAGGRGSESTNCEADIVALIPKYNLGVTMTDTPTFWFYIPPSTLAVESLKFSLLDSISQDQKEIWTKQLLSESKQLKSGLFKVKYQGQPLKDSSYQWEFSYRQAGCPNTQTLSGAVRKEIFPNLVLAKNPRERFRSYAQNGIWHELLTELITIKQQQPKNPQLVADFRSLFFDSEDIKYLSSDLQQPDRDLMEEIINAQVIN
jgi:Domain of Unknown Function (DUF928)